MVAEIVSGAIKGIAGVGMDIYNIQNQNRIDQRNFDYMVAQNELTRAREDTAHQREVADLQAAGLSPLASTGGASATAVSGYSGSPQMVSGSQFASSFDSMSDMIKEVYKTDNENDRTQKKIDAEKEINTAQLEAHSKDIENQIKSSEKISDDKLKQEMIQFNRNMTYNYKQLQQTADLSYLHSSDDYTKQVMQNYTNLTGSHDFDFVSDDKESRAAAELHNQSVMERYRDFIQKNMDDLVVSATSENSSSGWNASLGAGASAAEIKNPIAKVANTALGSVNGSIGGGHNSSNSSSKSFNATERFKALQTEFWSKPENRLKICRKGFGSHSYKYSEDNNNND